MTGNQNTRETRRTKTAFLRATGAVFLIALLVALLSVPVLATVDPAAPDAPLLQDAEPAGGAGSRDPNISVNINGSSSDAVNIVLLLTILTVLPSLLIMMTSFTRIIIVFSLLRNAIGLQQTPPNQVMIGLALFLSMFIMNPVITDINENAYKPFSEGDITAQEFLDTAKVPLQNFMLDQTKPEDLNLFFTLSGADRPESYTDYPMTTVIPAFITSEIKRAFTIGFFMFIPFLIIDMVVSSALMSMGMMMLPPATVSLPFKLLLFVLVDGWGLLIKSLVMTFNL